MKQGKVWLVGAGPSDAGLLTLKGKRLLETADVVVYDRLVGTAILEMIPKGVRQIDVGKRAGHHPVPQEEINAILLREAQQGNRVVRLKGGDPFLFGRGGEELELLTEHGVPFEVVPGVPSAIAVPAYAGIPVTHRDFCSSVHIITAHKKRGSTDKLDYAKLVGLDGTLVFLMGVGALADICHGLLEAGMEETMPAAVLERGTTAAQRRIVSTVAELPQKATLAQIQTPAIILVGKVCALAEMFHWAENRPLGGARVFVTRPREKASHLAERLTDLGAEVLELPAIATRAIQPNAALERVLVQLEQYQWVVFTSAAAVEIFFEALKRRRMDVRTLAGMKFAVVGRATQRAVEEHGLFVDVVPEQFGGRALGEAMARRVAAGEQVLLLRAKEAHPDLGEVLTKKGIAFEDVAVYETILEEDSAIEVQEGDLAAFASASAVKGFVQAVSCAEVSKVQAVCIGPQTAAEAGKRGMACVVAKNATIDDLVNAVVLAYRGEEEVLR